MFFVLSLPPNGKESGANVYLSCIYIYFCFVFILFICRCFDYKFNFIKIILSRLQKNVNYVLESAVNWRGAGGEEVLFCNNFQTLYLYVL